MTTLIANIPLGTRREARLEMSEAAAADSGGLDFADSTKDELIAHIMLQRTLIRRLYRKIMDLEAAGKKDRTSPSQPIVHSAKKTAATHGSPEVTPRPMPHVAAAAAAAGGDVEQSLKRIESLLNAHYRGTEPLDFPTVSELEGLQEKLSGAYTAYRSGDAQQAPSSVQQYKQMVLDRADAIALGGDDDDGAVPFPQLRETPRKSLPGSSPVPMAWNGGIGGGRQSPATLHRDNGFLPEKLPSPKRSGTYRGGGGGGPTGSNSTVGLAQTPPPPPATLLHLLQQRYASPRAGIGSALTSPRSRRDFSPSKSVRRQRVQ